ncbi:MAG: hypothetical protein HBSIN02_05440 [Bacteroidia bacterium]|nr:MAG: hypothetical protein HBSIN02_05440 [Bacteroidia bacterium]
MPGSLSAFIAGVLLVSCAGQAPPPGGPEDYEPPEIVSVFPAPYTTGYKEHRIALEFNEFVDRTSVNESIFISPAVGPLEFDWSGKEVEIAFEQKLRENTTYVVTVGTDVKDLRRGNRMAKAFTLAFSTGNFIDRGRIEGTVYAASPDKSPEGVMVFAYNLDRMNPDTLDPSVQEPDYITQTGSDGGFFFRHITIGRYRLYAVRDEFRNLRYDAETDEFGVLQRDVVLTDADTLAGGLAIRMAREDTTAPRLMDVRAENKTLLTLRFSEGLDSAGVSSQSVQIVDTVIGRPLVVHAIAFKAPEWKEMSVVTAPQDSGTAYMVRVSGLRDSVGLTISPLADRLVVEGSWIPDTVGPRVLRTTFADSTTQIRIDPVIAVYFSEPVLPPRGEPPAILRDTLGEVACDVVWLGQSVELRPRRFLRSLLWHTLSVRSGLLEDYAGNRGKDTILAFRFQTLDSERFSAIEGVVVEGSDADTSGPIILSARDVTRKGAVSRHVRLEHSGPFVLDRLLEGRYTLEAFRDRNENRSYDAGAVRPFIPSERFTVHPDTLRLRARWPLEGVVLRLH